MNVNVKMMVLTQLILCFCSWTIAVSAISLESIFPQRYINGLIQQDLALDGSQKKTKETSDFSVFTSSIDDAYSLRIKPVDPKSLGIDTVNQWAGYLDYKDSKHFFYWFFESRNDPVNDPVILWLNGGPGCSSLIGLFFELGPSSINVDLKPVYNPYSWNSNASVIFLDQPVGVGFSYGDSKVTNTDAAAEDVYIFLELFFERFPHLRNNSFHISGESYAGHYLPKIAHEIAVVHEDDSSFKLSSVLIGNGFTDPQTQYQYYEPMACGRGGYPSVLEPEDCKKMNDSVPTCVTLSERCYKSNSLIPCTIADLYCEQQITGVYEKSGRSNYDIRSTCDAPEFSGACFKEEVYITEYLNLEEVQEALGVEVNKFESCSRDVGIGFSFSGDSPKPFHQYVAELVDKDIDVLIYAGDKDYICNWLGNMAWTDKLEWKYHEEYEKQSLQKWINEETNESLGEAKSYGSLTFLRVYDAGHMVPHDQPENSLQFLNSWIRAVDGKN